MKFQKSITHRQSLAAHNRASKLIWSVLAVWSFFIQLLSWSSGEKFRLVCWFWSFDSLYIFIWLLFFNSINCSKMKMKMKSWYICLILKITSLSKFYFYTLIPESNKIRFLSFSNKNIMQFLLNIILNYHCYFLKLPLLREYKFRWYLKSSLVFNAR